MYELQIGLLEFWIANWYNSREQIELSLQELTDGVVREFLIGDYRLHKGLCYSCGFKLRCGMDGGVLSDMFKSWDGFTGDYTYPVDGGAEYNSFHDFRENPKRLHLAKHCLKYLKNLTNTSEVTINV